MSSITENRLVFQRQGAVFTAANTTYPVDIVTDYVGHTGYAVDSNTNGIRLPERYANSLVEVAVTCSADDPPTVAVAVYGYLRKVRAVTNTGIESANDFTDMDYTGSSVEEIPWRHIVTLNADAIITTTTQRVGSVNVIAPTANSILYHELITVGAQYERLRAIPVVLTGTNPRCFIDFGIAGGQR